MNYNKFIEYKYERGSTYINNAIAKLPKIYNIIENIDNIIKKLPKKHNWERPNIYIGPTMYSTICSTCNFVIYYNGVEWYPPIYYTHDIPSSCEEHRMNQALE